MLSRRLLINACMHRQKEITRSIYSSSHVLHRKQEDTEDTSTDAKQQPKRGHHGRQSKVDIGEAAGVGRVGISTDFSPTGDMKDSSMDKSGTVNVDLARKSGMQSTGVGLDDSVWPNTKKDENSEKDVDLSSLRGPDRQPGLSQLKKNMNQKAQQKSNSKNDNSFSRSK